MSADTNYEFERQRMVDQQLVNRDITDPRVLDAMRTVPRHLFVPEEHRYLAYADGPLPIGTDQTISQPYIVALMSQLLELHGDENVLEIGTGSGYQAAILGHLAAVVHTVERHPALARQAQARLRALKLDNVHVEIGDGTQGWPAAAPYAAVLVTAAAPYAPKPLLNQLALGGRLIIPVGGRTGQHLQRWVRRSEDEFEREILTPVAFVPLVGEEGWEES
ncbi:MAG TPA: protein-L-isoaspartate(D-aspartate) O-methyltransferase [Anaerolineales bacterium]|nr:protein-L-isoaspartate(D-aspartate) O-methyltransferase [Anaerolineales bacterium]